MGMELFPSTDEESWEFIKRQIEEADYYLLILAGRYGSVDKDGIGYTEKEYDYAREIKKPIMAFIHHDLNKIEAGKSEKTDEGREKRDTFIDKVKSSGRLAKFYSSVEDLGGLVAVSIANIKSSHPQSGFIRANEMADPKKYADLLEENAALKAKLANIEQVPTLFEKADEEIELTLVHSNRHEVSIKTTLKNIFYTICNSIINGINHEGEISYRIGSSYKKLYDLKNYSFKTLKSYLFAYGLISWVGSHWSITDYGREQYALLLKQKPSE